MDTVSIGKAIAGFRKKCGMSQSELAEKLHISNKTVSRWENGLGYPEITQFPKLAAIFGVTVDYLMSGERKGITVAGNILNDVVKSVDNYPEEGTLVDIKQISRSVGGCAANTAINLAKIDRFLPITVMGRVGDDEAGRYVLSRMGQYGIDCGNICFSQNQPTGFSDVVSSATGERTIFYGRGANAEFCPEDVDISRINSVILHIGHILLLDRFDSKDSEYGTVMARFLHSLQENGIKTSVDAAASGLADFKSIITPSLKYCNYVFFNEKESLKLTNISFRDQGGKLVLSQVEESAKMIAQLGVKEKIFICCADASFCYDVVTGVFAAKANLSVPESEIKGSVGRSEAFAAGTLYGIYNGFDDEEILRFATLAAACSLFAENSTDGMLSKNEIYALEQKYGRKAF